MTSCPELPSRVELVFSGPPPTFLSLAGDLFCVPDDPPTMFNDYLLAQKHPSPLLLPSLSLLRQLEAPLLHRPSARSVATSDVTATDPTLNDDRRSVTHEIDPLIIHTQILRQQ